MSLVAIRVHATPTYHSAGNGFHKRPRSAHTRQSDLGFILAARSSAVARACARWRVIESCNDTLRSAAVKMVVAPRGVQQRRHADRQSAHRPTCLPPRCRRIHRHHPRAVAVAHAYRKLDSGGVEALACSGYSSHGPGSCCCDCSGCAGAEGGCGVARLGRWRAGRQGGGLQPPARMPCIAAGRGGGGGVQAARGT